jgi:predicted permease
MLADLKLAFRQLVKSPGFTAVAVLSLALGIGANTTIFSLVNEVLLKTLPVRAPEQLVLFSWAAKNDVGPRSLSGWNQRDPDTGENTSTSFSRLTYDRIRDAATGRTLADVFAFAPLYRTTVLIDGQAEVITTGQVVSGNYHAALGVPMAAGRPLRPEDDQPAASPVVVISDGYWQRRFAGDPAAIGRTLLINGTAAEIVGVTSPRFNGTLQVGEVQDLTLPLSLYPQLAPDDNEAAEPWNWWLRIMGRLQPGTTLEQARASVAGVFTGSIKDALNARPAPGVATPSTPDVTAVRLVAASGAQGLTEARRAYRQSLSILAVLVGLVLLVACANVANLLLARGAARQREIAVRLALGASRTRLLRQLLTESVLLGLLGGLAGLVLAYWGRSALLALQPLGRSGLMLDLPLDWRVLGFTTTVAVATGVLFGLAPAWRATRLDLNAEFAGGARTLGGGSRSRLARSLMVVQVALSLVLLVGAGLFTRTLLNLQQVDAGFNRRQLLVFSVDAFTGSRKREELAPLYSRIAERLAALPGVQVVTYSQMPLLFGYSWTSGATIQGRPAVSGENNSVLMNGVEPAFFSTYELPVILGRAFTARDDAAAPKVAIVNQAFAQKYFGGESAIGRRFGTGGPDSAAEFEIVGVVRDARAIRLKDAPRPAVYLPYAQLRNARSGYFALRTAGDPASLAPALRAAVTGIDPTLPISNLRTQEETVARSLAPERLFARLAGFFGGLALLLASIGLYGLLSYSVLRRTGEIGLRMALGAAPGRVLWLVVRESLLLVCIGTFVGIAAAAGLSRLVTARLFGLSSTDPFTYAAVALLLITVAVLASLLPARRATKVDPLVALRRE